MTLSLSGESKNTKHIKVIIKEVFDDSEIDEINQKILILNIILIIQNNKVHF